MTNGAQLVVIAKAPVAGLVKSRLCPPCSPEQAAAIAEASLTDTLATVAATDLVPGSPGATRRIIALAGTPGAWLPRGFEIIEQEGDGLDERLTAAFARCLTDAPAQPVIIVGMDTPQLTSAHLRAAAALLETHDAVIGPATDGGYWVIGLGHLAPGAITGVPMSASDTGARQLERLRACGYRVAVTDVLTDVDDEHDAAAVAATIPRSRFARAVHQHLPGVTVAPPELGSG